MLDIVAISKNLSIQAIDIRRVCRVEAGLIRRFFQPRPRSDIAVLLAGRKRQSTRLPDQTGSAITADMLVPLRTFSLPCTVDSKNGMFDAILKGDLGVVSDPPEVSSEAVSSV